MASIFKNKDLSLDDLIVKIYNIGQNKEEKTPEEIEALGKELVRKAQDRSTWFLFKHPDIDCPLIRGDKAFLYTDLAKAVKAAEQVRKKGIAVEVYAYKEYEEDIFEMLLRNGVQEIAFNKGLKGVSLSAISFATEQYNKMLSTENGPALVNTELTSATLRFAEFVRKGTDESVAVGEAVLARALVQNEVLYACLRNTDERTPLAEKINEEGEELICIYVFTDIKELRKCYPSPIYTGERINITQIKMDYPNNPIIINAGSVGLFVGYNVFVNCEYYRNIYNQLVSFAITACGYDKKQAEEAADDIMFYEDLCLEFTKGMRPDHFEYPMYNMVIVEGNNADSIRKITGKNPIDVYRAMVNMRKTPDSVQKILYQQN